MDQTEITLTLFNTTGIKKQAINSILSYTPSTSLLFLVETWLLSPNRFYTHWTQHHVYGERASITSYRGHLGISLLINPSFPYHVHVLPKDSSSPYYLYSLSCIVANTLIHCVYLPPETISDDFAIEILDSLPLNHPQAQNTILCSDFNARIPSLTGDHASNPRGSKLQKWIESNSLFFWNQECAYGKPTFIRHNGSSIIDFFLSTSYCTNPKLQIRDDISAGSDHKILNFSYVLQPSSATTTTNLTPRRRLWRLSKLKDPIIYDKYKERMSINLYPIKEELHDYLTNLKEEAITTSLPQNQEYIEHITTKINNTLYTTMDSTIGATPGGQKRRDEFWTAELQRLVDYRERTYKKWKRAIGIDKLSLWLKHQEAAARVRRALNKRRQETWRIFCDKLENDDYCKTTATIKRIRQRRTIQPTFSHINGPAAAAHTMAQHLENVYNGHLLNSQHANISPNLEINKDHEFPITEECVITTIQNLPSKKAPGIDHIRSEMLKPIVKIIAPLLHHLFHICWLTTYTPRSWRIAQVTPIYKKGAPDNPANFHPISLTSVFRKILEYCIKPEIELYSPPLDIAQGGFRPARSTLQQALCLQELSQMHKNRHGTFPTLAFLDVTSAYDAVNRDVIWETIQSTMPTLLFSFLKHLFNNVYIEVVISNATSYRFSPTTGVLQGSILSPFLYSLYINSLPGMLRNGDSPQSSNLQLPTAPTTAVPPIFNLDHTPVTPIPTINCLLYADDVVLIGTPAKIQDLLLQCEKHSYQLGYRWNPAKSVIVEHPQSPSATYQLYNSTIPKDTSFTYLGIPINYKGQLDGNQLLHRNTTSAEKAMRMLSSIGISPSGVSKLLSVRLYTQFIRPKLEYGLAIITPTKKQQQILEATQNYCIRQIYGAHSHSSTKVMRHMHKLPSMEERSTILQTKFLLSTYYLPDDALLTQMIPHMNQHTRSKWHLLKKSKLWQQLPEPKNNTTTAIFKATKQSYLLNELHQNMNALIGAINLAACRPKLVIDPILWLPMSRKERSRCIRWRLGWLPGGKVKSCKTCGFANFHKKHALSCLNVHDRLNIQDHNITDPISHLLNQLPQSKPTSLKKIEFWKRKWPTICALLAMIDAHQHPTSNQHQYIDEHPGKAFTTWIDNPSPNQNESQRNLFH